MRCGAVCHSIEISRVSIVPCSELGGTASRRRGAVSTRGSLTEIGMGDSRVNTDAKKTKKTDAKSSKSKSKSKSKGRGDASSQAAAKTGAVSPSLTSVSRREKTMKNKESENEARAIAAAAAERWLPLDD